MANPILLGTLQRMNDRAFEREQLEQQRKIADQSAATAIQGQVPQIFGTLTNLMGDREQRSAVRDNLIAELAAQRENAMAREQGEWKRHSAEQAQRLQEAMDRLTAEKQWRSDDMALRRDEMAARERMERQRLGAMAQQRKDMTSARDQKNNMALQAGQLKAQANNAAEQLKNIERGFVVEETGTMIPIPEDKKEAMRKDWRARMFNAERAHAELVGTYKLLYPDQPAGQPAAPSAGGSSVVPFYVPEN